MTSDASVPDPEIEEADRKAQAAFDEAIEDDQSTVNHESELIERNNQKRVKLASEIIGAHIQALGVGVGDCNPSVELESGSLRLAREQMAKAAFEFIESTFRRWSHEIKPISGEIA